MDGDKEHVEFGAATAHESTAFRMTWHDHTGKAWIVPAGIHISQEHLWLYWIDLEMNISIFFFESFFYLDGKW